MGRVVSCDGPIQRGVTDSETIKKTILGISGEEGWKRQNFVLWFLSPPKLSIGPFHSKSILSLQSKTSE